MLRPKIYFVEFYPSLEDYSFIILEINSKEERPKDGSPLIISKSWALIKIREIQESHPSISSPSGLLNDLLEVGHDQKDILEREANDPREESWNLQIGQLQKTIYKLPNMSNERLNQFSLASGLFDELLEVGHGQKEILEREANDRTVVQLSSLVKLSSL